MVAAVLTHDKSLVARAINVARDPGVLHSTNVRADSDRRARHLVARSYCCGAGRSRFSWPRGQCRR